MGKGLLTEKLKGEREVHGAVEGRKKNPKEEGTYKRGRQANLGAKAGIKELYW